MSTKPLQAIDETASRRDAARLLKQYRCGPIEFTGSDGLYERHLLFDNIREAIGAREEYEAIAHSVRDVVSQRWLLTEKTYEQKNPKRVYYLSMEFLLRRSLAHNFTNLLLSPFLSLLEKHKNVDFRSTLEHEPDAAAGRNILSEAAWLSKRLNRLWTNFPSG